MKCNNCRYEWRYAPDWTSPYGEWSCMHKECERDLYGTLEEDVENCEWFEKDFTIEDTLKKLGPYV